MKYIFSCLALLSALIPLWEIYQNTYFFVTISTGLLLGIAISTLGIWLKIKAGILIPLILVLFFLAGVPSALPEETLFSFLPSINGLGAFSSGLVTSWREVLTIPPPLGTYGNTLIPVYVMSYFGAILLFAALRSEKIQKIVLVIPVFILMLTTALTGTGGFSPYISGLSVVSFTLIEATLFAQHVRAWKIRAAISVISTLAITFMVSGVLSVPPAQDLRSAVGVPLKLDQQASPLSLYRALVSEPLASSNLLSISNLPPGQQISLAKMDEYNNEIYRLSDTTTDFIRKAAFKSAVDAQTIQKSKITLDKLEGPWLPLPGELVSLSFQGSKAAELGATFFYSAPSGTAVTTSKIVPGESYISNTLSIPFIPFTVIPTFSPGASSHSKNSSFPALDTFFESAVTPDGTPGQQLYQALQLLSTGSFVIWDQDGNPNQPGHDESRLTKFLTVDNLAGDSEQFAAIAALVAEKAGFPSRVAVGFISSNPPIITGKDAAAWVEILTSDGWKAIDPTPNALSQALEEANQETSIPKETVPIDSQPLSPSSVPIKDNQTSNLPSNIFEFSATLMLIILAVFALMVPALKLIRRSLRMKRNSPRKAAIDAWSELISLLVDLQVTVDRTKTRYETALSLNSDKAISLAEISDFAEFSNLPISKKQSETAWKLCSEAHKQAKSASATSKRLLAPWNVRSFLKP